VRLPGYSVCVTTGDDRPAVLVNREILFCCNNEFICVRLLDHISEDSGLRDVTLCRHVSVSRRFEGTYYFHFEGLCILQILLKLVSK
jgi:hypothetical protein